MQSSDPDVFSKLGAGVYISLTVDGNGLLGADSLPSVAEHPNGVRKVSTFAVETRPGTEHQQDRSTSKAGLIVLQQVEFLQGDGWLVSCWHMRRPTADGGDECPEEPPEKHRVIESGVRARWTKDPGKTSGDLGLAIMAELAQSYTRARRTFVAWHELWELEFDRCGAATEKKTLAQLRIFVSRMREHLEAVHLPGYSRNPEVRWFNGCTRRADGNHVDEVVERALSNLRSFGEVLRASTELVATMEFSQHSRRTEQFQEAATVVATILLVPTLVAGIFGANTALPGGSSWWGFELMTIVMVLGALLTYGGLRYWRTRLTAGPDRGGGNGPRAHG